MSVVNDREEGTPFSVAREHAQGRCGNRESIARSRWPESDRAGERWFTVGVSPNIVDASFEALLDSINYKLIRDGAPAP